MPTMLCACIAPPVPTSSWVAQVRVGHYLWEQHYDIVLLTDFNITGIPCIFISKIFPDEEVKRYVLGISLNSFNWGLSFKYHIFFNTRPLIHFYKTCTYFDKSFVCVLAIIILSLSCIIYLYYRVL